PGTLLFLKTSFAILATRLIIPLSDFADTLIIPHRLQSIGLSPREATAFFGEFTGMATTIVSIPTILIFAMTHILTAKITSDWQTKKWEQYFRRVKQAMQFGWLWGVSSSLFLLLFSSHISVLVIGDETLSTAITCMSATPLLAGIRDVTTTVLWGVDNQKVPLTGLIMGAVISALVLFVFIGIPAYKVFGISFGLLSMDLVAVGWNLYFLQRKFRHLFSLKNVLQETKALFLFLSPLVICSLYLLPRLPADELPNTILSMLVFFSLVLLYIFFRLRFTKPDGNDS
ncbi:MAG: polysaccharide biosynthesis C-terminal domain-containing protein, partial [Clostridia bacterium]